MLQIILFSWQLLDCKENWNHIPCFSLCCVGVIRSHMNKIFWFETPCGHLYIIGLSFPFFLFLIFCDEGTCCSFQTPFLHPPPDCGWCLTWWTWRGTGQWSVTTTRPRPSASGRDRDTDFLWRQSTTWWEDLSCPPAWAPFVTSSSRRTSRLISTSNTAPQQWVHLRWSYGIIREKCWYFRVTGS